MPNFILSFIPSDLIIFEEKWKEKNIIYAYFFWQDSCFVQFLFNVIYFRLLYKHVEAQIRWRNVLFSH